MIGYLKGVLHAMACQESRRAREHRRATRQLRIMILMMTMRRRRAMAMMMVAIRRRRRRWAGKHRRTLMQLRS